MERVDAALMGEIPTDRAQVATLRVSLIKLANSTDVPAREREAFHQIALQLNGLTYKYSRAKERYDNASHVLKTLSELQDAESQFSNFCLTLESKRQATVKEDEKINQRLTHLSAQLEFIKREIDSLRLKSTSLSTQINSYANRKIKLYAQANSLHREIELWWNEEDYHKRDLNNGREGLAEANKVWNGLRQLLDRAKKPDAEGST